MSSSFRRSGTNFKSTTFKKSINKTNQLDDNNFNQRKQNSINNASSSLSWKGNKKDDASSLNNSNSTYTFRRRGTKPWTGGLTLTSFGHREMDAILGGGQPLGTTILLEVDRWTEDLGSILLKYWSSEAVSHNQTLLLVATTPDYAQTLPQHIPPHTSYDHSIQNIDNGGSSYMEQIGFVRSLPRDLHLDKFRSKECNTKNNNSLHNSSMTSTSILEEETNEDLAEENDDNESDNKNISSMSSSNSEEGLKIAWQYHSKVQQERSGLFKQTSNTSSADANEQVYCHSYDLNSTLISQFNPEWESKLLYESMKNDSSSNNFIPPIDIFNVFCDNKQLPLCGFQFFQKLIQRINHHLKINDSTVVRLLIVNAPVIPLSIALPLLVSYIRANSLPVVILCTIHPWLNQKPDLFNAQFSIQSSSDAVLHVQGFSFSQHKISSEYQDLSGLLSISKMSLFTFMNYADHKRPLSNRYGLKRDKRKLQINMLHIPPEEFASGGTSVSGDGVRSGGGRSIPSSKSKSLNKKNTEW